MPANLTPVYKKAEQRYRQAVEDSERLSALQEMLQVIPKHKGTEKLQAEIKSRVAKLKRGGGGKKAGARQKALDSIPSEGAAQIPLVGAPNCGKSQFLTTVSNAKPDVADYPFTTRTPTAGMMPWENIQFQLIDLPPVAAESYEGWITSLLFRADLILLFADLGSDNLLDDLESLLSILASNRITLERPGFEIVEEEHSLDSVVKQAFLLANRCDLDEDDIRLDFLREEFGERFPFYKINSLTGDGIDNLQVDLFDTLQLMRVYTKTPGHEADLTDPVVLTRSATVADAAREIHKDFAEKLLFAKIWGEGKHEGQRVQADFVLIDGDILEFHI